MNHIYKKNLQPIITKNPHLKIVYRIVVVKSTISIYSTMYWAEYRQYVFLLVKTCDARAPQSYCISIDL